MAIVVFSSSQTSVPFCGPFTWRCGPFLFSCSDEFARRHYAEAALQTNWLGVRVNTLANSRSPARDRRTMLD